MQQFTATKPTKAVRFSRLLVLMLFGFSLLSDALLGNWQAAHAQTQSPGFANPAFNNVWNRTDKQVASGQLSRTWLWGPGPFSQGLTEEYAEAPGGTRLVQYFDKSRMELTNPAGDKNSPYYVTNGLIAKELMSGQMQVGNNAFHNRQPALIGVAGDPDDKTGPTYAALNRVAKPAANDEVGVPVAGFIDREGNTSFDKGDYGKKWKVSYAYYEPTTKQNIAGPFWSFLTQEAQVLNGQGQPVKGKLFDPVFYATGLPITGAYWAEVKVGGEVKDVLIQAFERRVLTFTPTNTPAYQVEMGNIGRHYFEWRYKDILLLDTRPAVDPLGKADPLLIDLVDVYNNTAGSETVKLAAARKFAIEIGVLIDEDADEVEMEVELAKPSDVGSVSDKIKKLGGAVDDVFTVGEQASLLVAVPLKIFVGYTDPTTKNNFLRELATTPGVDLINLPALTTTEGLAGMPDSVEALAFLAQTVKNEGVQRTGADKWQAAGFKGKGAKVGIIDIGYRHIDKLRGTALPADFSVVDMSQRLLQQDSIQKSAHGTGVAEIIHSLAPEAQLFAVSISGTDAENAEAIDYLVSQKVDIISISLGSNAGAEDGTSPLSRKIEQVNKDTGIVFFIAAGNEGEEHYAGIFAPNDNRFHQWQPGVDRMAVLNPGTSFRVLLRWDQWLNSDVNPAATDFDLIVEDKDGNVLSVVDGDQRVRPPLEIAEVTVPAGQPLAYIKVKLKEGAPAPTAPTRFHIFTTGGSQPQFITPVMAVGNNADSRGAIAVGAVDPPLGTAIGSYSSQGPLSDGRLKPEISAPSNVGSAAYEADGGKTFNGTSAATPQVSGLAALLKGANPTLTGPQIVQVLLENAKMPEGLPVPNPIYGYGRADLTDITPGTVAPKGTLPAAPTYPNPETPLKFNPNFSQN